MCGILGSLNLKFDKQLAYDLLKHRGPDAFGFLDASSWSFVHARLSIVGLNEHGRQPLQSKALANDEDVLVFNGEIYNYVELAKTYIPEGILDNNYSDTEVLLYLLNHYGLKILNQLNGMFAFAYYCEKTKKLYLVRDRYGVKPCYYFSQGNKFAFCSEIFPLIKLFDLPVEFNFKTISESITQGSLSDYDEYTTFNNILQVKAGEYLEISGNGSFVAHKWYNYDDFKEFDDLKLKTMEDFAEYYEHILTSAIKLRVRADVPVSATLSGGLDSSIIYVLSKEALNLDYAIFTYQNSTHNLDESSRVKSLVERYGDDVKVVKADHEDWNDFNNALFHLSAPIWRPAEVGFYNVYRAIHDAGLKVVLEGHGSDECLGGWGWTLMLAAREEIANGHYKNAYEIIKAKTRCLNKALFQSHNDSDATIFIKLLSQINPRQKTLFQDLLKDLFEKSILPMNLRCWDRLSMANSIECRCPFLDYRLVEFSRTIPTDIKVNHLGNKAILRYILNKYKAFEITENNVKQGYTGSESQFINHNKHNFINYLNLAKDSLKDLNLNIDNLINYVKNTDFVASYDPTFYKIAAFALIKEAYSNA